MTSLRSAANCQEIRLFQTLENSNNCGIVERYGYKLYSEANAFTQFAGDPGWPKVDLMFVVDSTFEKLEKESVQKGNLHVPSPRHMIALKLHAATSPTRSEPEKDWADIEALVKLHRLDPDNSEFHDIILRYGGQESLARMRAIWQRSIRTNPM